ncbi:MAG: hypothetical protein LUD38_17675 [Parabacteroides sp.]|nr:hypothetical protein [Parabacteroides sp.]
MLKRKKSPSPSMWTGSVRGKHSGEKSALPVAYLTVLSPMYEERNA